MLIGYKRGQGSIVLRLKVLNSSVSTGAGLTGLSSASSGLIISTIADNEASATAYTVAGSTIESITTLGTFAAPTATKCRFKEVDSTNHKGVYEIQIADARYAVSNAKSLLVSILGATNAAETDVVIPLRDMDPYDAVRAGLTALPNAAAEAAGGLYTRGTGAGQINQPANGNIDINLVKWLGTAASTPTVAGVPNVNVKTWNDLTTVALPLVPTTAGRTLDVSETGEAGIDWANIGAPTTSNALTGTTIATTQKVDIETIKTNPVVNAGTVTFPTTATLASTTNITGGTVTTATNVTNAVSLSVGDSPVMQSGTATAGSASTITIQTALGADSLPVGCVIKITGGTGANQARTIIAYVNATKVVTVDRAWTTTPDATSVYSILYSEAAALSAGLKVTGVVLTDTVTTYTGDTPQTGDSFARIGAAGAGLTNINLPDQTMNIIGDITGNLSGSVGSVTGLTASNLDATVSSRATSAQILTTALSEAYAADGAAGTLSQILFMIQQILTEMVVAGTTATVKKLDGTTTAATFTLSDATNPTSITRAT